jgi:hypothetical protein
MSVDVAAGRPDNPSPSSPRFARASSGLVRELTLVDYLIEPAKSRA